MDSTITESISLEISATDRILSIAMRVQITAQTVLAVNARLFVNVQII